MLSVFILYGLIMTLTNAGGNNKYLCKLQIQSCGPNVTTLSQADYYCTPYITSKCKFPDQIVVGGLAGPSACCNNDFCCFANEITQDSIGCAASAPHAKICKDIMDANNNKLIQNVTPAPTTTTATTTNTTPGSTVSTSSTTKPPGTRDCSVLAIDEFLLQCSSEFQTAQQQIIDLDNRLVTLETNLQSQIDQNVIDIVQLQTDLANGNTDVTTQIQQLQDDIDDANGRIDLFAAKSPGMFNINGIGLTDVIIGLLLIANAILMCYIYCWRKNSKVGKKHVYVAPIDGDSDVEQINEVKM